MTQSAADNQGRLYANWDSYWNGFMTNPAIEFVRFNLIKNACSRLLKEFPSRADMKFCELGSGTAVVSRFLGDKYNSDIYTVDNNPKALEIARGTFKDYDRKFIQIQKDVFDLKDHQGQFDLVHSGGLIEHFVGDMREEIVKAHCDLVKLNGYILILVPTINGWYKILNEGIFKQLHLLDEIKEVPWSYQELELTLAKFGFKVLAKTTVITEIGVLAQRI